MRLYGDKMNDTAFYIGDIAIKWYAIIITSGMILALFLFMYLNRRHNIKTDPTNYLIKTQTIDDEFCLSMFLFAVIFAVLGARLFFVIPRNAIQHFFNFREGGLTIIGAIPVGALGIGICCWIYKKSPFRVLDIVVPCMLLGQIIGRWGNFINGELYGMEITVEWLQFFPFAVKVGNAYYAANFFYEMCLNAVGMIIALVVLHRFGDRLEAGVLSVGYIMWYGIVRGCLEFLKVKPHMWGNVKAVQLICFIVVPIALIILILLQRGVISLETQRMYNAHFRIPLEPPVFEEKALEKEEI